MYTMRSRDRLAAWRAYPHRGSCPADGPLPPNWFKCVDEHTMVRDERGAKLHYGGGIGGPSAERCRPDLRVRRAEDVLRGAGRRLCAERCEHWADEHRFTVYRGVVASLPHGRGWLAGVEWGEIQSMSKGTFAFGGGWIDCGAVHGSEEDAAIAAGESARIAADDER